MTLSGKVSLKVKMTILIIEILIIGSYGVVVGDKNMGAIRNDAIASMEEYVSEEHPEYSQEEIQQELQPILQKMQRGKESKTGSVFLFYGYYVYTHGYMGTVSYIRHYIGRQKICAVCKKNGTGRFYAACGGKIPET